MRRGVLFQIPTMRGTLYQILKCINVKEYCWYNVRSQDQVMTPDLREHFFTSDFYQGDSFLECIQTDHFADFVKLQAYHKEGDFFDIHSYEEFQKSDCQLLLLIYDLRNAEIFAKSQEVIQKLYENAEKNAYVGLEYITDDNDGRTRMDVLY